MKKLQSFTIVYSLIAALVAFPSAGFAQEKNSNRAPSISGLTAPTMLEVDETGTWQIRASDPEGGDLWYSMDWGEGKMNSARAQKFANFVQDASFTHAYAEAGTYKVKASVRDEAGKTSSASASVLVSEDGTVDFEIDKLEAKVNNHHVAQIKWRTNDKADGTVYYSTTSPVDLDTAASVYKKARQMNHTIVLEDLDPGTTYYAVAESVSQDGSVATSEEISFTTKDSPARNQAPVITELDGPETLDTGEEGIWTVEAYDPENQPITYTVDWGEIRTLSLRSSGPVVFQTSTFTHTYENAGEYNIRVTATDSKGASVSKNTKVTVEEAVQNESPVITEVTGPETLIAGEEGSWTIEAYDPENKHLTYSANWGETTLSRITALGPVVFQTSTLTHTYANEGDYDITFTVTDEAGAKASRDTEVRVNPAPVSEAPVISGLAANSITPNQATLVWTTDKAADTRVWVSSTSTIDTSVAPNISNTDSTTSHSATLTDLEPDFTYYAIAGSADAEGRLTKSEVISFTTLAQADTTMPVISNISLFTTPGNGAMVNWRTDESADSKVYYSTSTPVVIDAPGTSVVSDAALKTEHSLSLVELVSGTLYYFFVQSADASGNIAKGPEFSFTIFGN